MKVGSINGTARRKSLPRTLWVGLILVSSVCGRGSAATAAVNNETGTFYADPVALNGGNLRGYVTLQDGVPTAVGMELSSGVLTNIPSLPLDAASATFGALPPEAAATPFAAIAVGDFPTGHQPAGIGDKPHFHPIFLLMPPQQPDPPNFALEGTAVAPAEVPADHVNLGDVAPGIGIAYQDPSQPQNQPGWDTVGQNYFFYNGHMNGIALGATNAYMLREENYQDIARGDVIKQPQTYPKTGYYPQRYTVSYDYNRHVHIFELSDFQLEQNAVTGP
jgi:hypothetical protein